MLDVGAIDKRIGLSSFHLKGYTVFRNHKKLKKILSTESTNLLQPWTGSTQNVVPALTGFLLFSDLM